MASGPAITAKFVADTSKLTGEVDKATSGAGSKLGGFAKNAAVAIGGAFAVDKILDFGKQAIDAASNLEESISKVGVVFGSSGRDIVNWSKDAATSMGLSQQAALEAAGTYGNLAVSLGLPQDQAASMSKSLVGLASDMASFNNVPVDEALQALQSGLTGETEPLKKFGVNLNEAALKAEAMSLGLSDGKGPLDAAAKAQASYSLIMKQSTTAQGDFARTADGLANKQKIAAAQTEDMKAKLGDALLPVMEQVTTVLNTIIPILSRFVPVIVPIVAAFGIWTAAVSVATTVQTAFGLSLALSVGWIAAIVVGIAALVAGVIWAWNNVDWFRTAVEAAFNGIMTAFGWIKDAAAAVFQWISDHWPLLLAIITGPIGIAVGLVVGHWDTVKAAATAVWQWVTDKWNAITGGISSAVGAIGSWISTLVGYFNNVKDAATSVWQWVSDKFNAIKDAISNVVGGIQTAIASVVSAIKAPINAVINAWNGLEFRIPTFTLPSVEILGQTIGGQTFGGQTFGFPDIPKLAGGGILTQPTLFIGGEAGTEIVAPEAMLRAIMREEGGGHYELNIYPRTADSSDIAYGFRRLELLAGVA